VAPFRFSHRAEADLVGIGDHTLRTWGEVQAVRYLDALDAFCQVLAGNPSLGRSCEHIRRGLRRIESGQHVVFYRADARGILISRILHKRMLPDRYSMDDDDDPAIDGGFKPCL
jgi:toxin ParE1/3/4